MKVAILCPGKSLKDTLPKRWVWSGKPRYDRVVAVTDAIFADAPIDVWCFQEGPKHTWSHRYKRWGHRVLELKPTLWVYKGLQDPWRYKWHLPKEMKILDRSVIDLSRELPWGGAEWRNKEDQLWKNWMRATIFHAVLATMVEGATEIEMFGCDNKGHCNYDPRDASELENRRTHEHWNTRWEKEKEIWKRITPVASENGVTIRQVSGTSLPVGPASEMQTRSRSFFTDNKQRKLSQS